VPTSLTVGETLRSAQDAYSPRVTPAEVAYARELVGLKASDSTLSGSLDTLERRKLLLACLLQRHTSVLLMDEPCSGLLADEIDEIDAVIRRIVEERGCAVIVVEHRLELLFAIAKRVVVLDAGAVIASGPAHEVFELPIVRKAYFEDDGSHE
jgi:ABC-type branched-subunit amino acid transport system ATPase component